MGSVLFPVQAIFIRNYDFHHSNTFTSLPTPRLLTHNFHHKHPHNHLRFSTIQRLFSYSNLQSNGNENEEEEEEPDGLVQDLRVPIEWLEPSKALEESEWLRVTLHKWLDDEYCPEATNVEISKVAARSYYESLVETKETDVGEILIKMAKDLESISYQESFHGAFSSANAAISLIIQRTEQQ